VKRLSLGCAMPSRGAHDQLAGASDLPCAGSRSWHRCVP